MRESQSSPAQAPHVVEVEPRRSEEVVTRVVLDLEHAAHEGEPVRVHAGRRKTDHRVAGLDPRAVDQRPALHDPDTRAGEVELVLAVDTRQLRRLAADQRASCRATHLRSALDELGDGLELDPIRCHVVEEDERVGAAGADVVDAVRRQVGAARAERAALAREDELRPHRVGRGGQEAVAVQRMEPRERAEAGRSGGLDCGTKPLDHRVRLRDRDAGSLVGLLARVHGPSVQSAPWTSRRC